MHWPKSRLWLKLQLDWMDSYLRLTRIFAPLRFIRRAVES